MVTFEEIPSEPVVMPPVVEVQKVKPIRKKFTIQLDNHDPQQAKQRKIPKDPAELKLQQELDNEDNAKNYPRLMLYWLNLDI